MVAKWSFSIVVICAVGFGGWSLVKRAGGIAGTGAEEQAETALVLLRDSIRQEVEAIGSVSSSAATEIKSEVSGRIQRLGVEDGQLVTNKQVLVELDRSELESEQEERVRTMKSIRLRLEKSERDFARQKDLHDKGFVTEKDFDDARTELALSQNELEIQEARLQTLREKLAKVTILAPHDGMVLDCDIRQGQVIAGANSVSEGTLLMKVADVGQMLVKTEINEVDVTQLEKGMSVLLEFDSIPDLQVEGVLDRISPSAKDKASVRVFPLEITCAAPDIRIKPGISANVTFTLAVAESVLGAGISTVFVEDGKHFVYVLNDAEFERREIEVGVSDDAYVEVKSGLLEGDEVALARPPEFIGERPEQGKPRRKKGGRHWH